jgi:3-oxoacyl-[acyl-carrier protein] reductase
VEPSGHVALVTGSGRSLGRAMALRLAANGTNIITNSRQSPEECEETAEMCKELGVKAVSFVADVSKSAEVAKLAEFAKSEFGYVDILINNVGIAPYVPFLEITEDDWHQAYGANVDSMFFTCQAFIPGMVERGWGRIINITGQAARHHGKDAARTAVHTTSSKGAAIGLTRSIAAEFAPKGITCNEMGPARIDTEPRRNKYYKDVKAKDRSFREDKSESDKPKANDEVPVGRVGLPSEFAAAAAFLASEEAGYITGQTLLVNGGLIFT